jgi:cytochrome P450
MLVFPPSDMMNECPVLNNFCPVASLMATKEVAFGFGRRLCLGIHVADNLIWIAMIQILSAFDILHEIVDGMERIPPVEYGTDMTRYKTRT